MKSKYTPVPLSYWAPLPKGIDPKTQVRSTRIYQEPDGTKIRVGGAHPYSITAETDDWVIYRAYADDGTPYREEVLSGDSFERAFERRMDVEKAGDTVEGLARRVAELEALVERLIVDN